MQNTRTFKHVTANTHSEVAARPRGRTKTSSPLARLAKKIFKRVKIHLLLYTAFFFILPSILPEGADDVLLTFVYPLVTFFLTTVYSFRFGFIKHYLAIPILLFTVASFSQFEALAFLYGFCYLLTGVVAMTFGTMSRKVFK